MIWLGRVTGRGSDAAIAFRNELLRRKPLIRRIAPVFSADALVHALGEGLGELVGDGGHVALDPDRAAGFEHGGELGGEGLVDEAALGVALLPPGVGEVDVDGAEALGREDRGGDGAGVGRSAKTFYTKEDLA